MMRIFKLILLLIALLLFIMLLPLFMITTLFVPEQNETAFEPVQVIIDKWKGIYD